MTTEKEKMLAGELYNAMDPLLVNERRQDREHPVEPELLEREHVSTYATGSGMESRTSCRRAAERESPKARTSVTRRRRPPPPPA